MTFVDTGGGDMEHLRVSDPKQYRVVREVPVWGVVVLLVGGFVFAAGQAIALYVGQREQQKSLIDLTSRVIELTVEVAKVTEKLNTKDVADVRHDLRLDDLSRRLANLERFHAVK